MKQEPKNESGGRGRGNKETLADKPLDFENLRSPAFPFGFGAKKDRGTGFPVLAAQSLTLVPRFLLLNRTETLATQAKGYPVAN